MAADEDINTFVRENLTKDLDYHVTGEMIVVAKASNTITREVVLNLGYMFIAIFLFISVLFLSLKAGALANPVNIMSPVKSDAKYNILGNHI